MSTENLRSTPLILPPVLARALGVHASVVDKTMVALRIEAFQPTASARKLISLEQAERIAKRIRPAARNG